MSGQQHKSGMAIGLPQTRVRARAGVLRSGPRQDGPKIASVAIRRNRSGSIGIKAQIPLDSPVHLA